MKTITINPDEKFYAAIGEYRTLHASPKPGIGNERGCSGNR